MYAHNGGIRSPGHFGGEPLRNYIACITGLAAFLAFNCSIAVAVVVEIEPNDSFITAQQAGAVGQFDSEVIIGSVQPGDVDIFSIDLTTTAWTHVQLFLIGGDGMPALAVFDDQMNLLEAGQLPAPNSQAALATPYFQLASPSTIFVAITGSDDSNFLGNHDESFEYVLVVSTVPSPPAFALLLLSGLAHQRRRKT